MNLNAFAVWMVCTMGAVVFAATPRPNWRAVAAFVATLGAALSWGVAGGGWSLATLGIGVFALAGYQLARPTHPAVSFGMAGILAGVWGTQLVAQGVPLVLAAPIVAILPAASARLATTRSLFLAGPIREEALLIVLVLGGVAAGVPVVSDGWRTASALNVAGAPGEEAMTRVVPLWTVVVALASVVSGAAYARWSRR